MPARLCPGPDGWWLTAEGAALRPGDRLAVIADVHLGYEWARGMGGDVVPAHSLGETLDKLGRLFGHHAIETLVVAGDLVESGRLDPRTRRDLASLSQWLEARQCRLHWIAGNHDPQHRPALPEALEWAGWTLIHGHKPSLAERVIMGHLHPVLRAEGLTAPCFLIGPQLIVLPAFSTNAAGLDATRLDLPGGPDGLRLVAGLGNELLDFGPLRELTARLR